MLLIKTLGTIGGCPTSTLNVLVLEPLALNPLGLTLNQVGCPKTTQGVVLISFFPTM
jgi:hypothetical protein